MTELDVRDKSGLEVQIQASPIGKSWGARTRGHLKGRAKRELGEAKESTPRGEGMGDSRVRWQQKQGKKASQETRSCKCWVATVSDAAGSLQKSRTEKTLEV